MNLIGSWIDLDETWLMDGGYVKINHEEFSAKSLQWLRLAVSERLLGVIYVRYTAHRFGHFLLGEFHLTWCEHTNPRAPESYRVTLAKAAKKDFGYSQCTRHAAQEIRFWTIGCILFGKGHVKEVLLLKVEG